MILSDAEENSFVVPEAETGVQPDIDAARDGPKIDMRRLRSGCPGYRFGRRACGDPISATTASAAARGSGARWIGRPTTT